MYLTNEHYCNEVFFKISSKIEKKNVRNKAKVKGSICNAYLVEEASEFCACGYHGFLGSNPLLNRPSAHTVPLLGLPHKVAQGDPLH